MMIMLLMIMMTTTTTTTTATTHFAMTMTMVMTKISGFYTLTSADNFCSYHILHTYSNFTPDES